MSPEEIAFRKYCLFTKDELCQSINLTMDYYRYDDEIKYTETMRQNVLSTFEKFLLKVEKIKLPNLIELWKYYQYDIAGDSISLSLREAKDIELDDDGCISSMSIENEHVLITQKCDYLSVDEFAKVHNVTPGTVTQWIKRGKLKNATLMKGAWTIPSLEEKPERGYSSVQYLLKDDTHLSIEEYPLAALSESIFLYYDDKERCVICSFNNWKTELHEKMELEIKEAEHLEYELISSGKVKTEGRVQFVPTIEKSL